MTYLFSDASPQTDAPANPFTVRVVDDNAETCESLRFFLESLRYRVLAWTDPEAFLRECGDDASPGCVLLDVRMPAMSGLEVQEALNARGNALPIIFLTGHGDIEMAVRAVKRGALDFLTKPADEAKLRGLLLQAEAESEKAQKSLAEHSRVASRFALLTEREKEVIRLAAQGLMNKVIADRLAIAEKTVKQHRGAACRKLGVRNAVEIAALLRKLEDIP